MIELENIVKSYNGEAVLRGVNLKISDGEFVSVMGASGSGKSTLLGVTGGFIIPDGGRVLWDNRDIGKLSPADAARFRCTRMGFVFQNFRLISTLTAEENIMLPALLSGRDMPQIKAYVRELCQRLSLGSMLGKYPHELSGGQQQRTAIVRALAYNPGAVILDEPTGALDSAMQCRVMELLKEINSRRGTTVVQVTHSADMAAYGDRIVRIKDGAICG